MSQITQDLLEELKNTLDIEAFFDKHHSLFIDTSTSDYLNELLNIKGLSLASIATSSGVGEYVYKIFGGQRKASRDILISISLGMRLNTEETQLLLRVSKFAILDARDKRDSIIIYAISHFMSPFEADDMLEKHGFTTLN